MYKETEKKINDIINKYGEACFHMGISILRGMGYININNMTITAKKMYLADYNKKIETKGNTPVFSTEFLMNAADIAYELSLIDSEELNVYIQENIHYDAKQGILPKQRLLVLLKNALTIIYENIDDPVNFIETLSNECGFTDGEIESLGYESFLEYYYEASSKD